MAILKNVNIVGWYGMNNIGDDAFQVVFGQQLQGICNLKFTQRPELSSDLIIYGGGGVVVKSYISSLPQDKEWYAFGVDVPLSGSDWDWIKSSGMKKIYCRSKEYAYLAARQTDRISYTPDIVFAMDYDKDTFPSRHTNSSETWVGLTISHEIEGKEGELIEVIQSLCANKSRVFLIPMYQGVDRPDTNYFTKFLVSDLVAVLDVRNPMEAIGCFSLMDFTINMRFHGTIFSTMLGVPFVSLANKGKHSLFCEQEGLMDFYVDLSDFNSYKIFSCIEKMSDESIVGRLQTISFMNKAHVANLFSSVVLSWIIDES